MATSTSPTPKTEHLALHRVFAYSTITAIVILLIGALYFSRNKPSVNTAPPRDVAISATPLWYTDIIGPLTSPIDAESTLGVGFTVRHENGTQEEKTYRVKVDEQTTIARQDSPVAAADLRAGAILQVFGSDSLNLYSQDSFTATKILVLQ